MGRAKPAILRHRRLGYRPWLSAVAASQWSDGQSTQDGGSTSNFGTCAQRLVQSEHRPPTGRSSGDRRTPHSVVWHDGIGFKTGQRAPRLIWRAHRVGQHCGGFAFRCVPLPPVRFDLFAEALRSVHRDGHVEIRGAYYSVPPEFLGQRVWARWDGRTVRLFDQKMRPIALHAQRPPGAFSTLDIHLLPEKISGIERGTTWLLRRIEYIGPHATRWARSMLQHRGIEGVRVLMGLLSLANQRPRSAVERACEIALGHGAYHLRSLRQLIEHQDTAPVQQHFEFVQEHPIIRSLADYGQFV